MFNGKHIKEWNVMRNLDMTALRSFVTVAEAGGVTRAAGILNLTQSAVSMQLKRLEESMGLCLLDRSARTIGLTPLGEQLLGYGRRMLAINDEIFNRLTAQEYEGEVRLGVPHDIVYPAIPKVLQRFAADYPRVKVHLNSSFTKTLKEQFAKGEVDVILATEDTLEQDGETLTTRPIIWIGAPEGQAWKTRPLPLAFEGGCLFRQIVQRKLDEADIAWDMAVESNSTRTIEATVSADLAVHAMLEGTEPRHCIPVHHGGTLPELGESKINMYWAKRRDGPIIPDLASMIRTAYRSG
jgi:DNA-binding transcriptional LysR family regulator